VENCIICLRQVLPSNLPLLRSEPILQAHAEKHNPSKILFNHKVVDFKDEGDAVLVHVETGDGRQLVYRAHTYLVPMEARLWVLHAPDASL